MCLRVIHLFVLAIPIYATPTLTTTISFTTTTAPGVEPFILARAKKPIPTKWPAKLVTCTYTLLGGTLDLNNQPKNGTLLFKLMGDYSANGNRRLGNIPLPPRALFELEGNLCNEDDSSNWLPYIDVGGKLNTQDSEGIQNSWWLTWHTPFGRKNHILHPPLEQIVDSQSEIIWAFAPDNKQLPDEFVCEPRRTEADL